MIVEPEMTEAERTSYWQGAYERMAARNGELSRSVAALNTWQPIETAPKDGTVVLAVTIEAQTPKARVSWFEDGRWVRIWKPEKFVVPGPTGWWPTHWMPLPEPPTGGPMDE